MKDESLDSFSCVAYKGRYRVTLATNVMYGVTCNDLCEVFTELLRGHGYAFKGQVEIVVADESGEEA